MTIDRATRDAAASQIDYTLIDVLNEWLTNEKRNLDDFIANPQGHIEYNPYLILDTNGLTTRSSNLATYSQYLYNASQYRQGNPNITQAMNDLAFDNIPSMLWQRLYAWVAKHEKEMQQIMNNANSPHVPINDYSAYATFDTTKFQNELTIYENGANNLPVIIEYLQQNGL